MRIKKKTRQEKNNKKSMYISQSGEILTNLKGLKMFSSLWKYLKK